MANFVGPVEPSSLSGTMNNSGVTAPSTPAQVVQQQAPPTPTPTAPPTSDPVAPTTQPSTSSQFSNYLDTMKTKLNANNDLATSRAKLLTALYDRPLTPDELKTLPTNVQAAVAGGDKDQIEMQVRLLNQQLQGQTATLDQSVQFLAGEYDKSVTDLETQKQDAISNVISFVQQYGDKAGDAMKSLYGQQYIDQLKSMGIDVTNLASIQSISQQKDQLQYSGNVSSITIPAGTLAATNHNPGNLRLTDLEASTYGATAGAGGFAAFPDDQSGYSALVGDVTLKMNGQSTHTVPDGSHAGQALTPSSTLEDMIRIYAPTADGNDPVSYAQFVASQIGSTPDAKLSTLNPDDVAAAMAQKDSGTTVVKSDTQAIGDAIIAGLQPPPSSTSLRTAANKQLMAYLAKQGYDLKKATLDWTATQAFVKASNSQAQVRMKQAEDSVEQSLPTLQDKVDKLVSDGATTGFKFVNKASIEAAANGAFGKEAAVDAQAVIGQLSLITDELGQTFMGGNSPTDSAFSLAKGVLASNFTPEQFKSQIDLIQQNLQYRKNSWSNVTPQGVGGPVSSGTDSGDASNPGGI